MASVLFLQEYLPQEMLGIMYLSAALKRAGHGCRALFLPDSDWRRKLVAEAPDVVAYSFTTGMQRGVLDVNRQVKAILPGTLSVLGGPHPTFVPAIVEEEGVDIVCRGEGEQALVELCDRLDAGRAIAGVENLWVKDPGGMIHRAPQRPLIEDLDALGPPDRAVIYDAGELYRNSERKVFASLRGCPMDCSFCFHHAWRDKLYGASRRDYIRKRSVASIIAEVQEVRARWPLRFVHFVDDIFNIRTAWMEEFAERWPREVGLPFDVILMAKMTTRRQVAHLRAAGCIYARIAIESASDAVRNEIFRKGTSREQILQAAHWIKEAGIRLGSLNMLGAPGAALEDDLATLKLNIECRVDHPLVSLTQPYPDTDLAQISQSLGFATTAISDLPEKYNRRVSIAGPDRRRVENLHRLFALFVRFPGLLRLAPFFVRARILGVLYLPLYLLWSEFLVSEQNRLYRRCQGLRSGRLFLLGDLLGRVARKGALRIFEKVFARRMHKRRAALCLGEERVLAHID